MNLFRRSKESVAGRSKLFARGRRGVVATNSDGDHGDPRAGDGMEGLKDRESRLEVSVPSPSPRPPNPQPPSPNPPNPQPSSSNPPNPQPSSDKAPSLSNMDSSIITNATEANEADNSTASAGANNDTAATEQAEATPEPLDCPICIDPIASYNPKDSGPDNKEYPAQLPCGHILGHKCLFRWFLDHKTCPLCRYDVKHKVCGHHVWPVLPEAAPPAVSNTYQPGAWAIAGGVRFNHYVERRQPLGGKCVFCRGKDLWDEGGLQRDDDKEKLIELFLAAHKSTADARTHRNFGIVDIASEWRLNGRAVVERHPYVSIWPMAHYPNGELIKRTRW